MVVEARALVANLLLPIITKAYYYVILDAKVDKIVVIHAYITISSTLVNIHAAETNISKVGVAMAVENIHDA